MNAVDALGLPESRWVDVGGPVHYRQWDGPNDGSVFVCVHGLGGSLLNWAGVAGGLAERGQVVALDMAGFGLTPLEGRSADVWSNARLLDGFLRELSLPPAVLVGNSMGGMLSLIQAAKRPSTVTAMVLTDAAFPRPRRLARSNQPALKVAAMFAVYGSGRRIGERFINERNRRLGPEGLVRETFKLCAADPSSISPELRAAHVEMTRQRLAFDYGVPAFLVAARSIFRSQAMPGAYRELVRAAGKPALVIHGAEDQLVPVAAAREAVQEHADWRLEVLPDLGHIPMLEAPQRWLDLVHSWLDETGLGGQAEPRSNAAG